MADALSFVKQVVDSNAVAIFSKTWCPFCRKAKQTLSQYPIKNQKIIELDERNDGDAIQDALQQITGGRSVPRVFIGGKFIGGGDDTVRLAQSGELEKLLREASAL